MTDPLWTPRHPEKTNLYDFMTHLNKQDMDYQSFWEWSCDDMAEFWSQFWDYAGIIGEKGENTLKIAPSMRYSQFFPQSSLNYAENCLRRRDNDGDAIVFWGEDKVKRRLSWAELYDSVSRMQQFLLEKNVQKGDRVAGLVSNMPEAVIAIMACASIGAIWSSASPDFGVQGVLDRFGQIEPKIFLAVNGYYYNGKVVDCVEKINDIIAKIPSIEQTILIDYVGGKNVENACLWTDIHHTYTATDITYTRVPFDHSLVIMFSSGTTGIPKCIVHSQGGVLITHLKEHQLHCDIKRDDRVFYFTTCGWMMWNWQITALASEATLILYDGSPFSPSPNILWDYADQEKITLFGTAAKYIDALNKHDVKPRETHDLSSIRTMTSTGSPLVHESFDYVYRDIKSDIHLSSISGGTDIVSCFVLGNPISPVYRGEIQGAGLGYAMDALDDMGNPAATGDKAEFSCTKPFPSMPVEFWNDDDGSRYHKAYFNRFDNIWCHGDFVEKTDNGGWIIHGRSDATLNPGGVRIGTAEIYRQVEQVPEIQESLAIGQDWDDDVRVVLFVIMKGRTPLTPDLIDTIKAKIKSGASPRHVPAKIIAIPDIPRTKSGKITEIAVRDVVHGREIKNKEALANPETLDHYKNIPDLGV